MKAKLAQFEQMEQKVANIEAYEQQRQMFQGAFEILRNRGLVKQVNGGSSFEAVESLEAMSDYFASLFGEEVAASPAKAPAVANPMV